MITELLHKVAANPTVYDWIQYAAGCERVFDRIQPHLPNSGSLLEVGAGTGLLADRVSANVRYIWLDNDTQKLAGVRSKYRNIRAVLSDATRIALASKSVDDVLCVAVTHHIPDEVVPLFFDEMARVVKGRLIFLDPVLRPDSWISKTLWSLDRGSYPRTPSRLRELIGQSFRITSDEVFAVYHLYLLCTAIPLAKS